MQKLIGDTTLSISRIGMGLMQWGDIPVYDHQPDGSTIKAIQESIRQGVNFFDTAEIYGNGRSELHLGYCLKEISEKVVIATKFMPYPWRFTKNELRTALTKSLKRLGLPNVDLYQVHWPFPPVSIKDWMDAMADVAADGLIRAIGVSNYSPRQTERAYEALTKRGLRLASNQVKYNLLDRRVERSGLLDLCKELDIRVIAYSPLEVGLLTGKYNPASPPTDIRAWRYNKSFLNKVVPLIQIMREIGEMHQGKTPAQVALNWLAAKGSIPIPGAKNIVQATENAGALGWSLDDEEVERLNQVSSDI